MENNTLFCCDVCGCPVMLRAGKGRQREFRQDAALDIPDNFPVATCTECGETYLTTAEAEQLEKYFQEKTK